MTKKTSNIVPMPRRSDFATAADTFDIEALMRDLDNRGANSSFGLRGSSFGDDLDVREFGSRRHRAAA